MSVSNQCVCVCVCICVCMHMCICVCVCIVIIIINPLTARVVGAPQMILQPVFFFSPFFSVLHCPLALAELQACPFPDIVFPPLLLSTLSSSPFHCALQDGFGRRDERENVHTTAVYVSLPWSGGLCVVRLPAGCCHGLACW